MYCGAIINYLNEGFAARGDMEKNTSDEDRYSPVTQMRTARLVMAVAAQLNMELVTIDFPKAFLLGKMDKAKPVFMFAPEGFESFDGEIWQICLPLYGLTISSRKFYESLSEFMRSIGFVHFAGGDPCLFRRPKVLPNTQQTFDNHLAAKKIQSSGKTIEARESVENC